MRIAVFIKSTTFHKGFGGLETQNQVLCEGLVSKGHFVHVFAPKKDLDFESKEENGVVYTFIESDFRVLFSGLNKNSWINKSTVVFDSIHKQQAFDIVLSQSSAGLGIIRKKNDFNVPVVAISHGTALGELSTFFKSINSVKDLLRAIKNTQYVFRQYFGRQREFILHSNKVIAVSSYVKQHLIEETFIPDDRVIVINNGIDTKPFDRSSISENPSDFKLLYLSQVTKDKGADLLPEIAKVPELKNVQIDVIGDGAYFKILEQCISENNISNIKLLGRISHEEVINKLCSGIYSVFVFPTKRAEGFPMVLPEAMLAHLPTVVFDCGGVSDAIKEGLTGFLVKPEDVKTFIQQIIWLKDNAVERTKMGENAKIMASEKFSLTTMLESYEKVMLEIIK